MVASYFVCIPYYRHWIQHKHSLMMMKSKWYILTMLLTSVSLMNPTLKRATNYSGVKILFDNKKDGKEVVILPEKR